MKGRIQMEEGKDAKLITSRILRFDEVPKHITISFPDKASYLSQADRLRSLLKESEGQDMVMIVCKAEKLYKQLPANQNIGLNEALLAKLLEAFGKDSVKVG